MGSPPFSACVETHAREGLTGKKDYFGETMDIPRIAYRLLAPRAYTPGFHLLWRAAGWLWADRQVQTSLHHQQAVINFGNPYPALVRKFPQYNLPQVLAVQATAEALGRPVHVVDVGAAMGETALKVVAECGDQMASLTCVEGHPAFAELLRHNMAPHNAVVLEAMLSDTGADVPELVQNHHHGTAAAIGDARVQATTLDALLSGKPVDVLKVDTDGYDGLVLAGSRSILEQRPVVLFEWHPPACALAGTDEQLAFRVLRDYPRAVWYTKYGVFSHITHGFDEAVMREMAAACRDADLPDWHYDVVALPAGSEVSLTRLASTRG
jgi:FkbM family methyltransferase